MLVALLLNGCVINLALGDQKEALILLTFATMSVLNTRCKRRVLNAFWRYCATSPALVPRSFAIANGHR